MRVVAYDPLGNEMPRSELGDVILLGSIADCLAQAEIVLITTPDPVFRRLKRSDFGKKSLTVVDFWRVLDKELKEYPSICYIPIGRSIDDARNATRLAKLWDRNGIEEFRICGN
jgi:UDP-N-acetyl-D-mannosaminuronate dehydrogenase